MLARMTTLPEGAPTSALYAWVVSTTCFDNSESNNALVFVETESGCLTLGLMAKDGARFPGMPVVVRTRANPMTRNDLFAYTRGALAMAVLLEQGSSIFTTGLRPQDLKWFVSVMRRNANRTDLRTPLPIRIVEELGEELEQIMLWTPPYLFETAKALGKAGVPLCQRSFGAEANAQTIPRGLYNDLAKVILRQGAYKPSAPAPKPAEELCTPRLFPDFFPD